MNPIVDHFIHEIKSIDDLDYGDFMRKANAYLLEFKDHVPHRSREKSSIDRKIEEIQLYLQYYPNWEIESTRERLLSDAEVIDRMI